MKRTKQGNAARRSGRKPKKTEPFDFAVLFIVLTLVLFGVVMIFSSSYYYTMTNANFNNDMFYFLKRQAAWVVIGSAGMFMAMRIPYQFWKRLAFPAYLLSNFFLLLLPFFGTEAYGQKRWLGIGPLSFQPSEFTKIAVILYLSYYVLEHRSELANLKGFLKALGILLIPVGLIAVSNFSTALLLGLVGMVILFIASPRIWYFVVGAALLVPLGALAVLIPQFRYRLDRILIWLDPWSDTLGDGYQIIQSLYAVASGGLFGLGLGQSRQKTFIPEPYNDFIFSIICEELGLIGAGLVVALLAVLVWRGLRIAMRARDSYGMLVATGITSVIGFQSLINIGVVTNTIPNTGQPLPFISYGGTSLIFTMGMMGILMNISRFPKEQRNTE
ncbi:putative lipid II flippase FtsW [Anaerotignum lactatifermentans]|uniref:Probable peptidoglycan glycosyltransferase FtsW n=1 Tax=Anaerotignum lactatifermentans TaxID=160404 RepID=A0ABS2G564_9FIRM|nr:putative lipid II flippase FtsW [Anaerotignum lactatifermentans]MBM6828271.1 putative lipid II flippase FtsW [Anaerotignum lactatifermentans]MBM6876566.1 putative lipid II flippase FtsW [Anaerotignum lactatifermentans]MBM6949854.1 putative lipid II flippase FtsW [Anaerotignum lactatifermentans]